MDAYCQRQGLSNNQCRFIFDGERIKDDDSPETLEMENGDEIDVMVEQTGGQAHFLWDDYLFSKFSLRKEKCHNF